jgi:hypothetical protein
MRTLAARSAGPLHDAGPPSSDDDAFEAGPCPRLRSVLHLSPALPGPAWLRASAVAVVAWLPLGLLAALEGADPDPSSRGSFLLDVPVHARYLVALPLLVAVERWCLRQLAAVVGHFVPGGLVADADLPRWHTLLTSARRRLDRRGLEVVLAVGAFAAAIVVGYLYGREGASAWMTHGPGGPRTAAGWWRTLVSQPLFLLVLSVWLWRVIVWARFLWGVSHLELRLVPAHPDQAAGLLFIAFSLRAFAPVAFAFGVVVAGTLAGEIMAAAQPDPQVAYMPAVLAYVAVALVLFAGPLLAFAGPLHRARVRGTLEYGALATALGRRFEERWLPPGADVDANALAAPDFSATADLYSVAGNVRQMAVIPAEVSELAMLAIAAILPFAPLIFLVMPLSTLLKSVAGVLL